MSRGESILWDSVLNLHGIFLEGSWTIQTGGLQGRKWLTQSQFMKVGIALGNLMGTASFYLDFGQIT